MYGKLAVLLEEARKNPEVKAKFIESKKAKDPMDEFCKVANSLGYELTVGELFEIGEEYLSNLLKSCNGGAVYPIEDWDDWYDDFFNSLN